MAMIVVTPKITTLRLAQPMHRVATAMGFHRGRRYNRLLFPSTPQTT